MENIFIIRLQCLFCVFVFVEGERFGGKGVMGGRTTVLRQLYKIYTNIVVIIRNSYKSVYRMKMCVLK